MFTFDAKVFGDAFAGSTGVSGSQPGDGSSNPPQPVTYAVFRENKTGTLVAGDPTGTSGVSPTWGDPAFNGITWVDVPVTTKSDALFIDARLSSATAVDLDFELRTESGPGPVGFSRRDGHRTRFVRGAAEHDLRSASQRLCQRPGDIQYRQRPVAA